MKTVRFAQLVAKCGRPGVHLTWVAPDRDRTLMSALKEHRVMTVHHEPRSTLKDFGTVGLLKDKAKTGRILVFPRSLRRFSDRRIVGIDYDLLADSVESESTAPAVRPQLPAGRSRRRVAVKAPALRKISPEPKLAGNEAANHRRPHSARPLKDKDATEIAPAPESEATPPLTWNLALIEVEKARWEAKRRQPVAAYERLTALARRMRAAGRVASAAT